MTKNNITIALALKDRHEQGRGPTTAYVENVKTVSFDGGMMIVEANDRTHYFPVRDIHEAECGPPL